MSRKTSQKITYATITQDEAEKALAAYNAGRDFRTKKRNLDLDNEGRRLFRGGVSRSHEELKEQISCIFDQYGGWGLRLDPASLADAIATKILQTEDLIEKLENLPPLVSEDSIHI